MMIIVRTIFLMRPNWRDFGRTNPRPCPLSPLGPVDRNPADLQPRVAVQALGSTLIPAQEAFHLEPVREVSARRPVQDDGRRDRAPSQHPELVLERRDGFEGLSGLALFLQHQDFDHGRSLIARQCRHVLDVTGGAHPSMLTAIALKSYAAQERTRAARPGPEICCTLRNPGFKMGFLSREQGPSNPARSSEKRSNKSDRRYAVNVGFCRCETRLGIGAFRLFRAQRGFNPASISARRGSRNGGRARRSPRLSSGSSAAKPGPSEAISNRMPFGSRK